jgi:SAM-dependent methyltransferase
LEAPDHFPGGRGFWFAVVQCQDCGLCFTNPRPSPTAIRQFYPSEYRPHRANRARKRGLFGLRPAEGRPRFRQDPQLLPWHGQGRLLDFGCGGGSFLRRMHCRGWQVTGLDISPAAVYRVRTELGLCALVGTLPHPDLRPASFDVVTMWEALEHVHDPLEVLRQARRLLAPGGKLVVTVPNIDSLPFRWFGHAWYGLDLPRHLTHFAPPTLQLMLRRAGFLAGPVRMVRHSRWLRWSTQLARRSPRGPFWHRWLTCKPVSRLATWGCYLAKQSDCILVTAQANGQGA